MAGVTNTVKLLNIIVLVTERRIVLMVEYDYVEFPQFWPDT